MTTRLPRGTRDKPVTAGWEIDRINRDRFNAIAAHNGMSAGALLDLMIEAMVKESGMGRPVWLPADDGKLPIPAA